MASPVVSFGRFAVSWVEPSPAVDGYELEVAVGVAAYQKLGSSVIHAGTNAVTVDLGDQSSELTAVRFRMRSLRGGLFSQYSVESSTRYPLLSPGYFELFYNSYGGMEARWSNRSQFASTYILEKAVLNAGQIGTYSLVSSGTTPTATNPPSNTTITDIQLTEDVVYRYRITLLAGGDSSLPKTVDSIPIPLLPPKTLKVLSTPTGAKLTWEIASPKAVNLEILRGRGLNSAPSTIANISPTSTSYTDTNIADSLYSYSIKITSSTTAATSNSVIYVKPVSSSSLILRSRVIDGLPLNVISLKAWGTEPSVVAQGASATLALVIPGAGEAWETRSISEIKFFGEPRSVLDHQGKPHLVYRRLVDGSQNVKSVHHDWFDGTNWATEELFRSEFSQSSEFPGPSIDFAVDQSGFVHAAWRTDTNPGYILWYGTNRSGRWESKQISVAQGVSYSESHRIALGNDGTVFLLLGLRDKLVLFTHSPGDTPFNSELVPTGVVSAGVYDSIALQPFGSRLAVFFQRNNEKSAGLCSQYCILKDQGLWGQPTFITDKTSSSSGVLNIYTASSRSGRLVLALNSSGTPKLFLFTTSETWESITLNELAVDSPIHIGFNSADKLWSGIYLGHQPLPYSVYAWYFED